MKKFIYLLVLVPVLLFSSCNTDTKDSPVLKGIKIYNAANFQNSQAMEPLDIAFKLNVLLSEAIEQNIDINDMLALNNMTVSVGDDNTNYNVMRTFFNTRYELSVDNGVYTLTYTFPDTANGLDGKYIIDTKGKLLTELDLGESWELNLDKNNRDNFTYYINGSPIISVDNTVQYTISVGAVTGAWDINIQGYVAKYGNLTNKCNWASEYTLQRIEGDGAMTFANARGSVFEFSGEGYGTTFEGVEMGYSIPVANPWKVVAKCRTENGGFRYNLAEGRSTARFTGTYDESYYPSPECTLNWSTDSTMCGSYYTVIYNGHTE